MKNAVCTAAIDEREDGVWWYFFQILNISTTNALITRSVFLKVLVKQLVEPHVRIVLV